MKLTSQGFQSLVFAWRLNLGIKVSNFPCLKQHFQSLRSFCKFQNLCKIWRSFSKSCKVIWWQNHQFSIFVLKPCEYCRNQLYPGKSETLSFEFPKTSTHFHWCSSGKCRITWVRRGILPSIRVFIGPLGGTLPRGTNSLVIRSSCEDKIE